MRVVEIGEPFFARTKPMIEITRLPVQSTVP